MSALSTLVASSATAATSGGGQGPATTPVFEFAIADTGAPWSTARQVLPDDIAAAPTGLAQSRIIYLNRGGITVTPGINDARNNVSSIASRATTIPAWSTTDTIWNATVDCLRDMYAPFGVTLVTSDPGNVPHIEAVFGGSPSLFGMQAGVAGVSPFTTSCSVVENSIVYTFTDVLPNKARPVCEVMAQEIAHSYGLDHELLASDPMSYLSYSGPRSFKDELVSCGETEPRDCGIGGTVCRQGQNSVAVLRERLGNADKVAPTVEFMTPAVDAVVHTSFSVSIAADDANGVSLVELSVDGEVLAMRREGPYTFKVTADDGPHTLSVRVLDSAGNATTAQVDITADRTAPAEAGMSDDGSYAGGCTTTRSSGGAGLVILLGLVTIARRRR